MSAFDRLQNYSASNKTVTSEVFDVKTPQGCFLQKLHTQGYKMYEYEYVNDVDETLSEERFQWLSDDEKAGYKKKLVFTELHNMLTTSGDQLVLANAGSGKALANDTLVMTEKGYKAIGDLTTMDKVFGTDLRLHNIVGIYPQGKKKSHILTIESDSSTVEVVSCSEHLWSVVNGSDIEVISTKDIQRRLENFNSVPLTVASTFRFSTEGNAIMSSGDRADLMLNFLINVSDDSFLDTLRRNFLYSLADIEGLKGVNHHKGTSSFSEKDLMYAVLEDDVIAITQEFFDNFEHNRGILLKTLSDTYCVNYLRGFCEEDLELADKYLSTNLFNISHSSDDTVLFTFSTKFFLDSVIYKYYKIDDSIKYLANALTSDCYKDIFKAFNGRDCIYRVTKVEEIDAEVDMTCIEVDSDNHLFLLKGLIPTHNTTALIFKIMYDIITGESTKLTSIPNGSTVRVVDDIFVGTFLKTGADELAERLAYWQRGMGYTVTADRINFSTLHAEFKRALNTMGAATPIGSTSDINKCLKKAIDNLGITRDGGGVLTAEDYNLIGGIVTYYRGRLDNKKYNHPSAPDYGLTPVILDRLVSDFANQRQLAGIMDFEDLQELLYKFLYVTPNKAVQDFCANRYKYIYLDEFQDTSQIQYAIIKFYARGRLWLNRSSGDVKVESEGGTIPDGLYTAVETLGKIVVVGDNDQCVTGDTSVRMEYPTDNNDRMYGSDGNYSITKVRVSETGSVEVTDTKATEEDIKSFMDCEDSDEEYLEFKPIKDIKKGDYVCCGDNSNYLYSGDIDNDEPNKYNLFVDETATLVLEDPIKHKRRDIDLYKITVEDIFDGDIIPLTLECSGDHILFTDDRRLAIPDEVYKTLIDGTEDGSVERGFFITELDDEDREFTMVYAKNLTVGDSILIERFGGSLVLREITSIEKVHYDEVDLYDIRTDARNYSANGIISHNCLYQWRGSDNAIIEEMFDSDFRPCHTSLSYNYRCPSNILNAIVPSIKNNRGHERREYHSAQAGGIIKGYHFSTYKAMLKQLTQDIDESVQEGNTVAVLCRTNYDGVIPAFILEADKKYNFSISGQNMTLDSPLPRKLIAVSSIFTERSSLAVKNTLSMFVPRYAEWGIKQLIDTLKNNNKSVWQLPEADIKYSCPELAPMIKQLKDLFYENGKRVQKKEIEALKFVYHWLMVNAFGGSSLYCESARAYIEALLYIIDSNSFESVFEYLDYVTTLNEKLHARISNTKAKVSIATVHEFKGKERDTVIIWNDSEGVFPSSKTNLENEDEIEGERMVHYVACTRAKKKNIIYTLYGKESMFVKEMDLKFENPQQIGGSLGQKKETELSEDEKNLLSIMESI